MNKYVNQSLHYMCLVGLHKADDYKTIAPTARERFLASIAEPTPTRSTPCEACHPPSPSLKTALQCTKSLSSACKSTLKLWHGLGNKFALLEEEKAEPATCTICLEDVDTKDITSHIRLKCGHDFHRACAQEWFWSTDANEEFNGHCPYCRADICTPKSTSNLNDHNRGMWTNQADGLLFTHQFIQDSIAKRDLTKDDNGSKEFCNMLRKSLSGLDVLVSMRYQIFHAFEGEFGEHPLKEHRMDWIEEWIESATSQELFVKWMQSQGFRTEREFLDADKIIIESYHNAVSTAEKTTSSPDHSITCPKRHLLASVHPEMLPSRLFERLLMGVSETCPTANRHMFELMAFDVVLNMLREGYGLELGDEPEELVAEDEAEWEDIDGNGEDDEWEDIEGGDEADDDDDDESDNDMGTSTGKGSAHAVEDELGVGQEDTDEDGNLSGPPVAPKEFI